MVSQVPQVGMGTWLDTMLRHGATEKMKNKQLRPRETTFPVASTSTDPECMSC